MNLAKKLLNNPGFIALTVKDEQNELLAVTKTHTRKIKFAFFQSDFRGGKIPYWHVVDSASKSYQSTLSMQGLREWGII